MSGVGGPLLCVGDLLSDVGETDADGVDYPETSPLSGLSSSNRKDLPPPPEQQDLTQLFEVTSTFCTESSVDHNNDDDNLIPEKPNECQEIVMDYKDVFTTHELFETRESLCDWVRSRGKENGMAIVINKSDSGVGKKRPRVVLTCERSGQYRETKKKKNVENVESTRKRRRDAGSKKCKCPFRLVGKQVGVDEWELTVLCGLHNHPTSEDLGHSYLARLSTEEKTFVVDSLNSNSKPKEILLGLKKKFADNKSTIKTVYNVRMKNKIIKYGGRSEMQQLMHNLEEHGYIFHYRRCEKSNTVKDLFFAHPRSLDLMRCFPKVLIMDSTYKTNRYKLPLLEIVGVTSTQMTFSIAAIYLEFEREENYLWACTILRSFFSQSNLPNVILTDREQALMNAVEQAFPSSRHFLCRWHINNDIMENCKKAFRKKETWDSFLASWNLLVVADTESEFNKLLTNLQSNFKEYPSVLMYVIDQWITPYKERFVSCWTDTVVHFENTTTNRVESHHAALKKQLGSSQGTFETCWKQIHTLIETSHIAIKSSFEKSKCVVQHKYKSNVFMLLRGMVSINALNKICEEMNYIGDSDIDSLLCTCFLRKTCGLPCAHEIWEYMRSEQPIPLEKVDSFWRKLDMVPSKDDEIAGVDGDLEARLNTEIQEIMNTFQQAPIEEKLLLLKRLNEVANPVTTTLDIPIVDALPQGRDNLKTVKAKQSESTKLDPIQFEHVESIKDSCPPCEDIVCEVGPSPSSPMFITNTKSQSKLQVVRPTTRDTRFRYQLPPDYIPYVESIKNVHGDGHCGFRVIAEALGFGEHDWSRIRRDLLFELSTYRDMYADVFSEHKVVDQVLKWLDWFEPIAPETYWFCNPYMSFLAASAYNIAIVCLDQRISVAYLPLRTPPPAVNPKLICMANVDRNHYVNVVFKPVHPMPPVTSSWETWRHSCASGWKDLYTAQLNMLNDRVGNSGAGASVEQAIDLAYTRKTTSI